MLSALVAGAGWVVHPWRVGGVGVETLGLLGWRHVAGRAATPTLPLGLLLLLLLARVVAGYVQDVTRGAEPLALLRVLGGGVDVAAVGGGGATDVLHAHRRDGLGRGGLDTLQEGHTGIAEEAATAV